MSLSDGGVFPTSSHDAVPEFAELEIARVLARGPRAVVCEARVGGARYAIKILRGERRFRRAPRHEHRLEILRVYGDGVSARAVLMPLVVGRTLPAWIEELGPLPVASALELARGAALGLGSFGSDEARIDPAHLYFGRYAHEPIARARGIVAQPTPAATPHDERPASRRAACASVGQALALALTGFTPRSVDELRSQLRWADRARLSPALALVEATLAGELASLDSLIAALPAAQARRAA